MRNRNRLIAAALVLASGPLLAATDPSVATLENESAAVDNYAIGSSSTVETRLSASFTELAGSPDNASALVNGLRQGTAVNLIHTAPDGTTTITGIAPATGPMGYGNVRISLALAQQQLATLGIANPTPEQLAAALNGGPITYVDANGVVTTTTVKGVLEQRAAGMGWGDIAHSHGTKLGPVIAGLKATRGPTAPVPTAKSKGATVPTTTASASQAKGVAKAPAKNSASSSNTSAGGNGHAYGKNIVSAYGTGADGVVTSDNPGKGNAYGATAKAAGTTISTASSGAGNAAAAGVSTAQGKGNAYGQAKVHGKN